ncbi:hypothetical protein [Amycolatopsis sp. NPDC051061]|uniref:hypothetical protein n=1 Tax=Amycolatopsis sp. NPDC051061 TaxID=3155042 RepID=UPI0034486F2D
MAKLPRPTSTPCCSAIGRRPDLVGTNAGEIAADREGLLAFGVEDGREQRVDEALPWAALVSGGTVTVMDQRVDLEEGWVRSCGTPSAGRSTGHRRVGRG